MGEGWHLEAWSGLPFPSPINSNNHHCNKCIVFIISSIHYKNFIEIRTTIIHHFIDVENRDLKRLSCPISI